MSPSSRDWDSGPGADAEPGSDDRPPRSGALERADAILGAFDGKHRELSLTALVRRSGLPRSTTHRTAETLMRLGWLDKPGSNYRIGNRLFQISGLAPVRHQLRETVLPFLQDLYAATRLTVQLGVLDGTQVLVVEQISGHRPMPMLSQVGGFVPAHCSALGRAMLAYSAPEVIDAVAEAGMEARTARTITTATGLKRELAVIPHRGWALDHEEGKVGVSCIAGPIFGPEGEVAAALSITGPTSLVRAERVGPAVRLAAAAATRAYYTRR
ncbi:IclR family transcriptional regulator [Streptomyces canus]|uniref:IclR family transcriptional regulator n=1 Tax=Streptomyces canus TaxID=58343 RepID=UPI00037D62A6|nr:IclR family transcriptional regulator [Streptomyces canus]